MSVDPNNMTPQQQQQVLANVRKQVQMQAMNELVQVMTVKCFEKCVSSPGDKLSNRERTCLAMCMDRYSECLGVVNKSLANRQN